MKTFRHIAMVLLAGGLLVSCGNRVIPRGDFAKIYADMLLADQWVRNNYQVRRTVDTTLLYEPLFEKYGYDTDDYLRSVDYYMRDPDRFSRVLKKTAAILDKRSDALVKIVNAQETERQHREEFRPRLLEILSKFSGDSVWVGAAVVQVDSNLEISVVRYPSDTVFRGPEMIFRLDTAAVDSTAVDSLAVPSDSLAALSDSLTSALPSGTPDSTEVLRPHKDSVRHFRKGEAIPSIR